MGAAMNPGAMSFDTILVANRGEIACRVIRTARAMGLRTVAVHSEADRGAPHVLMADDAAEIGPAPVSDSYLRGDRIIAAALEAGAGAIHPGYGFLSENAAFAEAVSAAGLVFIGPPASAIRAMGDKAASKRLMRAAGVPLVPGYDGEDQSDARLLAEAEAIGFPLMAKASAGGGGRGMRLVERAEDLGDALARARDEATRAFGDGRLLLERAITGARHVEIQVFADDHGACLHLGERDCSVQRRHQKVLEEAPSPAVSPALRAAMGEAAVAAARAVDYRGAGTVEFLLDAAGGFYFLEMNTRLQVEHPVTEMVTGLDLVELQIRVARGEALPLRQEHVRLEGAAIEARLYAEDPGAGFLPSTGPIRLWRPASGPGVRIDAGIVEGGEVSPFYDPMLAKVIAYGPTREEARRRLIRALEETALAGPETNAAFLIDALSHPVFAAGAATTGFIGEAWPEGVPAEALAAETWALAAALALNAAKEATLAEAGFVAADQIGWRSDAPSEARIELECRGEARAMRAVAVPGGWRVGDGDGEIEVLIEGPGRARVRGRGRAFAARLGADGALALVSGRERGVFHPVAPGGGAAAAEGGLVRAPMPGLLIEMRAEAGREVAAGEPLAVIEAMKMQHRILAPVAGRVSAVHAEAGAQVASGAPLFEVEAGG